MATTIGAARVSLYLDESFSLKDKRQVVRSITRKVRDQFNVGIAESNMISMAAGLAECGYIPVASSLASFILANGYDQLRVSVAVGLSAAIASSSPAGLTASRSWVDQ